jgi:hypothetical protein
MFESYGCAIRDYAFAQRTGRLRTEQLDPVFLEKCRREIIAAAQDHTDWARASAYGTSFPQQSKRVRRIGWYFSTAQAFDIAVAEALSPASANPNWRDAILSNLNYEAGCNPNNVVFVTGLGWKRQREIVHQYAQNARRILPPSGIPLGSLQEGFMYIPNYGRELGQITYPMDSAPDKAYGFYDRWGDSFNVATEFTVPVQGRCLATLCYLMATSPQKSQPWRATPATITGLPVAVREGQAFTVTVKVPGMDITTAQQVIWEADAQEPTRGLSCKVVPTGTGHHWIEAEAQWPDGRRAFAVIEYDTKG